MRSKNINPDGSGNGPESDFINRTLDRGKELQFYSSGSVKVEQTTRGTRFRVIVPPTRPAASGGLNLRGEWDPTKVYNLNDMVVISMGANQGTFVAMQTNFNKLPTTGAPNWLQLPGGLLGAWM